MSVAPILMTTAASVSASASGAGATDVVADAGEAFGAMVATARAAATDDQASPADTKVSGRKTNAKPAEAADTEDKGTEETGVAANLLTGAALYLIQPQPAPKGETAVALDGSAGSPPSLPAVPPTSGPAPEAMPTAAAPEAATDFPATATPAAPPVIEALPKGETIAAGSADSSAGTPSDAAQPSAGASILGTTQPKTPEPAAPGAPVMAANGAIDLKMANAVAATSAASDLASAPTTAAVQQAQTAIRQSGATPPPTSTTTDDAVVVESASVTPADAAVEIASPIQAKTPAQTVNETPPPATAVAGATAPLRASNAAASDKTLSAAVTTEAPPDAGSPSTPSTDTVIASADAATALTGSTIAKDAPDVASASLSDIAAPDTPDTVASAGPAPATTSTSTGAVSATGSLSSLSRATIETTAQIAAQITRRLEGRSTRFEMKLAPEGLGNVDVSLDIGPDGQLAARLAFDNPLAATELRGRADELRRQLEESGFTIARDALDFAERDPSSSSGGDGFDRRQNSRAFANASRLAADVAVASPASWVSLSLSPRGVDVKV